MPVASLRISVSFFTLRSPDIHKLPTNIVDFRGFDSSIILILRGGILTCIGNIPESLSQAMLVGVMLVEGLGVPPSEVVYSIIYHILLDT